MVAPDAVAASNEGVTGGGCGALRGHRLETFGLLGCQLGDHAQTPEGLREGWVAVQSAWQTTVSDTPPELVDAHVEDEWSLAQTLRHLILATEEWAHLRYVRRDLARLRP